MTYLAVLPEILLALTGILILLLIPWVSHRRVPVFSVLTLGGLGAATVALLLQKTGTEVLFSGTIFHDNFSFFCRLLFLLATALVATVSISYLEREALPAGEFFALLLFATVGMLLMAGSADLIMTFLGLEVLSISTYILVAFRRSEMSSAESAMKYFILGAFSTAFLLYGIALIYGTTGSTHYLAIARELAPPFPRTLLLGVGLLVVGFGFKAALAPFHIWTPDTYQGAPLPITAHLAVGSKAAAMVALVRIFFQVFPSLGADTGKIFWISAVLTMVIGNVAALTQSNIKRMLAYSSIAHAGYLLVGIASGSRLGAAAVLFYLVAYTLMTLGAFAVVQVLSRRGESSVEISDYRGIGYRHPFLSTTLSIFLVSLAGIPATAGFMGKLFLLAAAAQVRLYGLVVVAVVASAVAVYYYLAVIVTMFMRAEPEEEAKRLPLPISMRVAIAVMAFWTLYLGFLPSQLLALARRAVMF